MYSIKFQRSPRAIDQSLVYRSNDVDDRRIGDVLVQVKDIPSTAQVVCVLLGAPQHIGVERNGGRPGAAEGPAAFRRAFTKLAISAFEDHISSGALVLADAGDIETEGKTLEQIHDEQYDVVEELLTNGCIPFVIGGGHDTAWPTIRALESMAKPYSVVNIDAHADVRPLKDGGRAHSGSPFHQMLTQPSSHLVPGGFAEFGLQASSTAASHLRTLHNAGMHVCMLDDVRNTGVMVAWQQMWSRISGSESVYVSLDLDALASAYAPGVSAPAADGFTPAEVSAVVRHAGASGMLKAFDVVELNPSYDIDNRTAKLAATLTYSVIEGLASRLQ